MTSYLALNVMSFLPYHRDLHAKLESTIISLSEIFSIDHLYINFLQKYHIRVYRQRHCSEDEPRSRVRTRVTNTQSIDIATVI